MVPERQDGVEALASVLQNAESVRNSIIPL
jgi:hypothetical protein